MEAFLVSAGIVALAEIGDKTQLLSFFLAARYRRPVPIILAILVATLLNHALAGATGVWISHHVDSEMLRRIVGVLFLGMAAWTLIPDKASDREPASRLGVFGTSLLSFFLLEMGDKTQVATVVLAARYPSLLAVVGGTTAGMLLANVPAVLLGQRVASRAPLRLIRVLAAAAFAILGAWTLLRPA